MRLLLDTHALIWLAFEPERLGDAARAAIVDPGSDVFASHVSLWEIAIKRRLGKLDVIDRPALEWFQSVVPRSNLRQLAISAEHLGGVESLPQLHGDPFDRLLISQAVRERMSIVTLDDRVTQYHLDTIW